MSAASNRINKKRGVNIPQPMIDVIDRIVMEHPDPTFNRQQFIELAIKEKIDKIQRIKARNPDNASS